MIEKRIRRKAAHLNVGRRLCRRTKEMRQFFNPYISKSVQSMSFPFYSSSSSSQFTNNSSASVPTFQPDRASLWMGDLDTWMDENWLKQLWLSYGFLVSIKQIRDRTTGNPAGYAFIDFSSLAEASHALTYLNGQPIPGTYRIFKLNWASGTSFSSNNGTSSRNESVEYSIYVCDLPPTLNDYQLFAMFQGRYPTCKGARIVYDPLTRLSKGYGFVRFGDEVEQQRAMLEMHNQMVQGTHRIRCAPAQVKISGSFTGSGSGNNTASTTYTPTYAMNLSGTYPATYGYPYNNTYGSS